MSSDNQVAAQRVRHEVSIRYLLTSIMHIANNHFDLQTQVLEVDARLAELTTAANNYENLLRENQLEVHNAHKRGVRTVLRWLFFLTCIVTCIVFNLGWVFYKEAIAEQARVDAGTARVAYLKELWLVQAYFLRDGVMTYACAGFRRFLWKWLL